jgi:formaldehyde-activating enzyme
MAKINGTCVGESLVGEGNEVAHIDLIMGPRGSAVEAAFTHALTNNKDGFTSLLAVIAPNLLCKPPTILFNKVTIKGAKQAVQMFGPAQHAVAKAVADSVADGTIPPTKPTTCLSVSVYSSIGMRPTNKKDSTITTIRLLRNRSRAPSKVNLARARLSRSAIRSNIRSPRRSVSPKLRGLAAPGRSPPEGSRRSHRVGSGALGSRTVARVSRHGR